MPSWFWIMLWVLAIATLAFFFVREQRRGRPSVEVDRSSHAAVRESDLNRDRFGPHGPSQTWVG